MANPAAISPTAHYTGEVWARNGMSHPALSTCQGRLMYLAAAPTMLAGRLIGGPALEPYLLARHRAIDALLTNAINLGEVEQVVELAAGMSPRGWRFSTRHGSQGLVYVEADLPAMAERKRRALARIGPPAPGHEVRSVDASRPGGAFSLEAILDSLDPGRGTAVITEGLLQYLDEASTRRLWERIARGLGRFPSGRYLSDLIPATERGRLTDVAVLGLRLATRAPVGMPFPDAEAVHAALIAAGFAEGRLVSAGARLAHVLDARA